MSEEENNYRQKIFVEYMDEGRSKPALVAAKFCLLSQIDPGLYESLCTHACNVLEMLSEMEDPTISFSNVYAVLINTDQKAKTNPQVRLCLFFYKLRTGMVNDEELDEILWTNCFAEGDSFATTELICKESVCKGLASLYCEQFGNALKYLTNAFDQHATITRALMSAFPENLLRSFRTDFVEAREKGLIPCLCNTGSQNLAFVDNVVHNVKIHEPSVDAFVEETSFINNRTFTNGDTAETFRQTFQLCTVHRLITELDDVIRLVCDRDISAIFGIHLRSGRVSLAEKYLHLHKNEIQINDEISKREINKKQETDDVGALSSGPLSKNYQSTSLKV